MSTEPPRTNDDDLAPYAALCDRPERWTVSRFADALRATLGMLRRARNEAETYRALYEREQDESRRLRARYYELRRGDPDAGSGAEAD